MSIRDILAPVVSIDADEAALNAAAALAERFNAQATALVVTIHLGSAHAERDASLSELLADIAQGAHSAAAQRREKIESWIARGGGAMRVEEIAVELALTQKELVAHARVADLVVIGRPQRPSRVHRAMLESALFGSGRPLLLVPDSWRRPRLSTALIGWDAKREAARAVHDALPLLAAAEEVVVATVDAKPAPGGHAHAPGRDIAAHLARHGVRATVRNVDSMGRSEGATLLDEATAVDADLIVMGGYGRMRAAEMLFGGVTRELLAGSQIPLLLSH